MKYQETLTLESGSPIKLELLIEMSQYLKQQGIEVYSVNIDEYFYENCQKLLMEKGARHILSVMSLTEAVLPKSETRDTRDLLVKVLSKQLQTLVPSNDLIIEDPYFFPKGLSDKAEYLTIFKEVFGSVIPRLATMRFITKPEYDKGLYEDIQHILLDLNPRIVSSHKTTNEYHDRFWIADESRGLVIGTSLNGIGKKYALTDFIKDEDTADIVKELRKANLI